MPELIIEECTRSGIHIGYHRVAGLPVRIGRALDNDIVIADPYVSPAHCVIDADSEGWIVTDCGSDNGTFTGKNRKIDSATAIASGDQVMIGRTVLRLFSLSHRVAPALRLKQQQTLARRFAMPVLTIISLAGTIALVTLHQFLDTAKQETTVSLFAKALPYLFFPLLWAGIWACAGFIIRRKGHYALQLIVANSAFILILLFTALTEYIDYFTSSTTTADVFQFTSMALLTALLLFVNLTITTGAVNLRRAIIAIVIGGGVIGIIVVSKHTESYENRIVPEYSSSLKPPYSKIAPSSTLDQFISDGEKLFKKDK